MPRWQKDEDKAILLAVQANGSGVQTFVQLTATMPTRSIVQMQARLEHLRAQIKLQQAKQAKKKKKKGRKKKKGKKRAAGAAPSAS